MEELIAEAVRTDWSVIPQQPEFWSAIAGALLGALVGGFIAYLVQVKALREGRRRREEDYTRSQKALGHALLFKMRRIHSNIHHIHEHILSCEKTANQSSDPIEPWQYYLPLGNPPEPIHFQSDEMAMILAFEDNDVFNAVVEMDGVHNSTLAALKVLNASRIALSERLPVHEAEGNILSGVCTEAEMLALRPRMIEVNSVFESIQASTGRDVNESALALNSLNDLLRDKLGMAYKLEFVANPNGTPSEDISATPP